MIDGIIVGVVATLALVVFGLIMLISYGNKRFNEGAAWMDRKWRQKLGLDKPKYRGNGQPSYWQ